MSEQHDADSRLTPLFAWREDAALLHLAPAASPYWPGIAARQSVMAMVRHLPFALLAGVAWFVLAMAAMLWMWHGASPRYFPSPDEAVNRVAVERIMETGRPVINRGGDDPEDLRHPRHWITLDDGAVPSYPPGAYVLQAGIAFLPGVGFAGVMLLSAAGVGALVAAAAVMGGQRRAAALLVPLCAFPATYWMLRPWMNMATFLSLLSFAILCWALWRRDRSWYWLVTSALLGALCATVRPDLAAVVMLAGVALSVAQARDEREARWVIGAWVAAGVVAVALIFALNWYTTGDPLLAGYEIADARTGATPRASLPFPLGEAQYLALPNGFPHPALVVERIARYWFQLGPIALLTVTAGLGAAMTLRQRPRYWPAVAIAVAAIAWYAMGRVTDAGFGGTSASPALRHSVVRYWSPVYLLVGLIPVVAFMRGRDRMALLLLPALIVLSLLSARELLVNQPESMQDIRNMQGRWDNQSAVLAEVVPADALVYTSIYDKVLWSHYETASLPIPPDLERASASIDQSMRSGRAVYIVDFDLTSADRGVLTWLLASRGWDIIPTRLDGVFRAVAIPKAQVAVEGP